MSIATGQTSAQAPHRRGRVGQRVDLRVGADPLEQRVEDGADRARVDRAVGVPTDPLVDRAGVQAGRAADAAQRLPADLVGQRPGAAVVEQHHVHLLRAVAGGDPGPGGGVGVHPLPGRASAAAAAGTRRGRPRWAPASRCRPPSRAPRAGSGTSARCPRTPPPPACPTPPQRSSRPTRPSGVDRNFSRRCSRAAPTPAPPGRRSAPREPGARRRPSCRGRCRGSRSGCGGSPAPGCGEGRSSPSCTISSARSVSHAAMPCAARASLSSISWVAIDLTFTTSRMPCALATSATTAHASAASRAQCTVAPRAVSAASRVSRCSSRCASVASLMPAARCRSASQSSTSATTPARLARIVPVAWARLRRSWVSASAARAATGNGGIPRNVGVLGAHGHAVTSAGSLGGRGQHLGQVHRADAGPLPREQPTHVHQARGVTGHQHLRPGGAHVRGLVRPHRHRRLGVLHRERPPEPAALLAPAATAPGRSRPPPPAAGSAGPPPAASAASGRSGGTSPGAGTTPPRRPPRARRRGTRSAPASAGRCAPRHPPTPASPDRAATNECWWRTDPAHDPDGTTTWSYPSNADTKFRTSGTASSR